jgi:branched-chain amino acid transport system substrate-binding protein
LSARSSSFAFAVALAVAACTLTRTSRDECKTNADCRTAFGVAHVCGGEGLCERAPPNPRCTTTFPADLLTRPESYQGAILVGVLMDRSVETQRARENAVRLAVTQVNEQKGLDGRSFGAIFCDVAENAQYDSLKRTDAAVASGRYLADALGVSAIVGPSASTDALAVFGGVKDLDTLVISPSATSPALTGADTKSPTLEHPGLLWRTAIPDTLQGAAIVRYLKNTTPATTTVALVEEKGAYGDALSAVIGEGLGTRVVKTIGYSNTSERDAAIVQAGGAGAKVVVFVSSQTKDAIDFLNAAKSLTSYDQIQLFLTDSAANADLLAGAAGASSVFPRVVGSRPSIPQGPTYELFKTSFSAAFRQDPNLFSFVPHAYDAAWLVFYGTAWSQKREGRISGTGIARGLRQISDLGRPEIPVAPGSWKDIVGSLGAGQTVNVVGASGSLDYDPATEETTGLIDIWSIKADAKSIATVTTIDPR